MKKMKHKVYGMEPEGSEVKLDHKGSFSEKAEAEAFVMNMVENAADGSGFMTVSDAEPRMNGYKAFYRGKEADVYARSAFGAREKAAGIFGAKKSYEVIVVLAEKDGKPVIHHADF